MRNKRYESLGHALFRSLKLTHILYLCVACFHQYRVGNIGLEPGSLYEVDITNFPT